MHYRRANKYKYKSQWESLLGHILIEFMSELVKTDLKGGVTALTCGAADDAIGKFSAWELEQLKAKVWTTLKEKK